MLQTAAPAEAIDYHAHARYLVNEARGAIQRYRANAQHSAAGFAEYHPDPNRVYNMLLNAAALVGGNGYSRGLHDHNLRRRAHQDARKPPHSFAPRFFTYEPTAAHRLLVESMPALLAGQITPVQALTRILSPEVLAELFDNRRHE